MHAMKKAIVTGISGQDGAYLAELLLNKGYQVIGCDRRNSERSFWRLKELGILHDIELVGFELGEYSNIHDLIKNHKPDLFFNLAAQSFVGSSFITPINTNDVNAMGPLRICEAIRQLSPSTRLYQASTSEMFGKVQEIPQTETTPFYPRSPYGVSKLHAHWMMVNYRESYELFFVSGILFNHESPLRGEEFVTRKITKAVAEWTVDKTKKLELGNLDAERDWGYAKDYVEAMYLMLEAPEPEDYVIATGEKTSVRRFCELAVESIGERIKWEGTGINEVGIIESTGEEFILINEDYFRPAEVDLLIGDPTKASKKLGWKPKTSVKELVSIMVENDIRRIK